MKTYVFSGNIEMGNETQPFEKEVDAESMKHAEQVILSELGSRHSVSRSRIEIESSEEAK